MPELDQSPAKPHSETPGSSCSKSILVVDESNFSSSSSSHPRSEDVYLTSAIWIGAQKPDPRRTPSPRTWSCKRDSSESFDFASIRVRKTRPDRPRNLPWPHRGEIVRVYRDKSRKEKRSGRWLASVEVRSKERLRKSREEISEGREFWKADMPIRWTIRDNALSRVHDGGNGSTYERRTPTRRERERRRLPAAEATALKRDNGRKKSRI
ncbi:hypothetical protein KM043_008329 [Ampulex compressa]|nr:hypothetical protein KM043_008329 [Ampulex compressa]